MIGNERIVYASAPRTATKWVEAAMSAAGVKLVVGSGVFRWYGYDDTTIDQGEQVPVTADHAQVQELIRRKGLSKAEALAKIEADRPLRFCTIRDPADWLVSFWMHMKGRFTTIGVVDRLQFPKQKKFRRMRSSFTNFVDLVLDECPDQVAKIFGQYIKTSDVVIAQPDLADGLVDVLQRAKYEFDPYTIQRIDPVAPSQEVYKPAWEGDRRARIREINQPIIDELVGEKLWKPKEAVV